ncbi:MAG TPA: RNA methyltransferase [Actinomycetota bacterium]|nr:RNA methyltransferase [Actinomycetota bacterium]
MTPPKTQPLHDAGRVLSSLDNPHVKAARRLHRRAGRDEARSFLAEGHNVVTAALASSWPVREVFVSADDDAPGASPDLLAACTDSGVPVRFASRQVIEAIATTTTPQPVVAVVDYADTDLEDLDDGWDPVVVLAEVRDPGNAGTLVRSAVAAGAGAVIFIGGSVDPFGGKTVRSSAGTLFSCRIVRAASPNRVLGLLNEHGFVRIGTEAGAAVTPDDIDLTRPCALIFGNEAWGLPEVLRKGVDEVVGIPMPGPVESLNVGVAGSILLYELSRQRRGAALSSGSS